MTKHVVKWYPISITPIRDPFFPYWIAALYDEQEKPIITLSRYVKDDSDVKLLDGQEIVDGFIRGGHLFTKVTHWAFIEAPEPPEMS